MISQVILLKLELYLVKADLLPRETYKCDIIILILKITVGHLNVFFSNLVPKYLTFSGIWSRGRWGTWEEVPQIEDNFTNFSDLTFHDQLKEDSLSLIFYNNP